MLDSVPKEGAKDYKYYLRLLKNENIVVTPHVAGRTVCAIDRASALCAYNINWLVKKHTYKIHKDNLFNL